jgi:tetratricopeptide (TPR) repeat protein
MSAAAVPELIDRTYRVEAKLGEGGMGTVYRATHRATGRVVAIKLLRTGLSSEGVRRSEFAPRLTLAREFQTLASLHHQNVIEVTDYGFDAQRGAYFAMELLHDARNLLLAGLDAPMPAKIDLLAQVLRALSYLHQRSVIHRDLKPSNVLFSGGIVRVVDFGIALTQGVSDGQFAGTLAYIAPELWRGSPPSIQSDLFAFGVIAYQLLTGAAGDLYEPGSTTMPTTLNLKAATKVTTMAGRFDLDRLDDLLAAVPATLRKVVGRLLAPEPARRHASAEDVLYDFNSAAGHAVRLETAVTRESFLRVPPLAGREHQLSRLVSALDASIQGRGSLWLLGGESGVGKSRLLSELRTLALIRGASAIVGQAVAEGQRSFHVWVPVLRALCLRVDVAEAHASTLKPLVPELPALLSRPIPDAAPLPPDAARERLFGAVRALLQQQDRSTLILLEDLHWADADSLRLLVELGGSTADAKVMIVGSYRVDEAPALAEHVPAAAVMLLDRLNRDECADLTASVSRQLGDNARVIDYLYQQSDGNVFFLIETLRELANQAGRLDRVGEIALPDHMLTGGIALVARRRLAHVPEAARSLLDLAATAGRQLDLSVIKALAPEVDVRAWLSTCAQAAVVEREAEQWRFTHDGIREAVLAEMDADLRRRAHEQVARAFESVYAGTELDAKAAILAYHFETAGDAERAAEYHARAGDVATRLCAYGESRQHYAAAIAAAASLPKSEANRRRQIDGLLKLVYTRLVSDAPEQNFARITEARTLLGEIGRDENLGQEDVLRLARINYAVGRVHFYRGDVADAVKYYRRVLPLVAESGDEELIALPSCLIGIALLSQGRALEAEPLLAQAIGPLEHLGEPFESFRATAYHGASLVATGRYREGRARLDAVLARALQIGQPSMLSAAYLVRGASFLLTGDWPLVVENLSHVITIASDTGDKLHMSLAWSGLGWAKSTLGAVANGQTCRTTGASIARSLGGQVMLADWYGAGDADMALQAGDLDRALTLAEDVARRSAEAGLPFSLGVAERVRGQVLSRYGRGVESDDRLHASIDALEKGGLLLQAAWSRLHWGVLLRQRHAESDAERLFQEAEAQFTRAGCEYALGELKRLQVR